MFVNIYHGRASFELGVEIGNLGESSGTVTLYNIVAWADALESEGFGQHVMFQVSTQNGVQHLVPRLAQLVQKYGTPFLKGDATAYIAVLEAQSQAAANYERQVRLDSVRKQAESAWSSKEFTRAFELYDSIRPDLTPVESKRIAYAKKHALDANNADNIDLHNSTKI